MPCPPPASRYTSFSTSARPDGEPTGPVLPQNLANAPRRDTLARVSRVYKSFCEHALRIPGHSTSPFAVGARISSCRRFCVRAYIRLPLVLCERVLQGYRSMRGLIHTHGRKCEPTPRPRTRPASSTPPQTAAAASPPPTTRSGTSWTSTFSCTSAAPANRSSRTLTHPGVVPDHAH